MSFTSSRSRWGDVAVASAAQLLTYLGTFLVMVTQLLAFQQRGASGLEVSALVICEALPMVALGKPIGVLVDRLDSRLLLVVAGLGQAASCLALAQATTLPAVLAGVTGLSVMTAVSTPTRAALLVAMVVRDDLPKATAIGQTAGSIGMMAGPALAGFLVGSIGPQSTVRYATIAGLATVVAAFAIRTRRGGRAVTAPAAPATDTTASTTVDSSGRWRLSWDRLLWTSAWGLTAVTGVVAAVNVVIVFFVMGTLHSTPELYGFIDASWMVGMLVGAWLVGLSIRPATTDPALARRIVLAAGGVCVAIIATGSVASPWWIIPCYFVGGMANSALNVRGSTLLGRRVPPVARGRAGTAVTMRVQAGSLAGFVIGGLLLGAGEPRWIVLGCGAAGLITAVIAFRVITRAAGRPDGTAPAGEPQAAAPAAAPAVS